MAKVEFELMKLFLSHLVGRLDVDSGHTRVGLVPFSDIVHTHDAFNLSAHSTAASIRSAIESLAYTEGITYTDKALRYVRTKMLTTAAGDRPGVHDVVILLTDGKSSNPYMTKVCTGAGNVLRNTIGFYMYM